MQAVQSTQAMFLRGVENRAANRTSKSPSISLRLPFGVWCVVRRTPEKRRDNRENQPGEERAGVPRAHLPSFLPSLTVQRSSHLQQSPHRSTSSPRLRLQGPLTHWHRPDVAFAAPPHALIARYMAEMGLDNVSGFTGPGWQIRTVKTFC